MKPHAELPVSQDRPPDARGAMTSVAPVYLIPVVQEFRRAGHPARLLFRGLGVSEKDLDVPGFMVSHLEASLVIRRALRTLDAPGLGLELGMRTRITERGALALGLLAAETLGDAIALSLRFPRSAGYLMAVHDERSTRRHKLVVEPMFGNLDLQPFLVDLMFAAVVRLRRQVTEANYSPIAVELVRPRPAHAADYESHFKCPVHFGCAGNVLVSDAAWLDFPLPMANAMAYRLSWQLLERESERATAMSIVGFKVERAIRRALPQVAAPADIADSLHLSERTLRRKLAQEGLSFRTLLDEGRKSRALELMMSGRRSITEVTAETGFSDTRSFSRAFKRWTGRPPSEVLTGVPQSAADTGPGAG